MVAQSVRDVQSFWYWSAVHAGAASHAVIVRHRPVKQPSLISGTSPSAHTGGLVVQVIAPVHAPSGSIPGMQVLRSSSQKPAPWRIASASLVQVHVATQALPSQIVPPGQSSFAVQLGLGTQDDRPVSQWKPVPQSLSAPQKPASAQIPSWQKHPAAQLALSLHAKPGGLPSPLDVLWSPK